MKKQILDELIHDFNMNEFIAMSEIKKRYKVSSKRQLIKALLKQNLALRRTWHKNKRYYRLVNLPVTFKSEIKKTRFIKNSYVLIKYHLGVKDFKELVSVIGFEAVQITPEYMELRPKYHKSAIPCGINIESCAHGQNCYLSNRCKAWKKHQELYGGQRT